MITILFVHRSLFLVLLSLCDAFLLVLLEVLAIDIYVY